MNYLAHLYLSGNSDEIRIGNFIGDYVKGNKYLKFPELISKGILMHRSIDYFTDNHPIIREIALLVKPGFGRHSGIIVDIYFDHFLAVNWVEYSYYSLKQFADLCHSAFISNFLVLPNRVKQFVPFIILHKRFESYSETKNLVEVFDIMSKRTSLPANSVWAVNLLEKEYENFDNLFRIFFEDLIDHVETKYEFQLDRPIAIRK